MSKAFLATCVECGAVRKVRRCETLRAKGPKCLKCGAAVELSGAAKESLAGVQAAQAGHRPPPDARRKPTAEEPARLVPVREAGRYEFWAHPTMYEWVQRTFPERVESLLRDGPVGFYRGLARDAIGSNQSLSNGEKLGSTFVNEVEEALYVAGKPYYKIWPSIAGALAHTEMRIDGEFFHLPSQGFEVRFPKRDNPLAPICACAVACLPANGWLDGRDWTCAVTWFSNVPQFFEDERGMPQGNGNYYFADIGVRKGQLLEDALDATQLMRTPPIDAGLARQLVRVAVGVAFFGTDRHETILPDLPRRTIQRLQGLRRPPTPRETEQALAEAAHCGMNGFKVGSEIELPLPRRADGEDDVAAGAGHGLSAGHIRRGHMRMQPHGKERSLRRLQFIPPTPVRPDLPMRPTHGYKIRVPRT